MKNFVILYNSYDYYDEVFGCRTYHNEIACYLVLKLKKNDAWKKYGKLRKARYIQTEDGNVLINAYSSEELLNNWDAYTNNQFGDFYFNDEKAYLEIAIKAQEIVYSEEFQEMCKALNKKRNGKDLLKERVLARMASRANDKKLGIGVNMEADKTLGKWLNLEEPENGQSINVIVQSLEKKLSNID